MHTGLVKKYSLMFMEMGYNILFSIAIGGKLLNGSKYIISEHIINEYSLRMNLTINRLKKSDFGEYTCSSVNAYGKAEGTITLKGKLV